MWQKTALEEAVEKGNIECIKAMMRVGERDKHNRIYFTENILHASVQCVESLEYLLSTGLFSITGRNKISHSLLMSAVDNNRSDAFFYLLNEYNFSLTAQTLMGLTVLHSYIPRHVSRSVLNTLLKRELILLNMHDCNGNTALHMAVQQWDSALVDWLLFYPSLLVNAEDAEGQTALHVAVNREKIRTVCALLKREDVDVNVCDAKGKTPLHCAVRKRRMGIEIAEVLLKHRDIRVNIKDKQGKTPLAYVIEAQMVGKEKLVSLLMEKGATV